MILDAFDWGISESSLVVWTFDMILELGKSCRLLRDLIDIMRFFMSVSLGVPGEGFSWRECMAGGNSKGVRVGTWGFIDYFLSASIVIVYMSAHRTYCIKTVLRAIIEKMVAIILPKHIIVELNLKRASYL